MAHHYTHKMTPPKVPLRNTLVPALAGKGLVPVTMVQVLASKDHIRHETDEAYSMSP